MSMTTISLLIFIALGAEPFQFERPAERPPAEKSIEPRPMTVPLPEPRHTDGSAGNAATGRHVSPGAHDERHAPADPLPLPALPVVYLYISPGCAAGDQMRAAVVRGEFVGLDVQVRDPPEWYTLCPTFHWNTPDGRSWIYPRDAASYSGVAGLLKSYDQTNPGARLRAVASRAGDGLDGLLTGSSPFDLVQKFTGPAGRFSFQPDQPINAQLDDRTTLHYPSLQGRYAVRDGKVTLVLDPPLPAGNYRKFLNFGFTITGAAGPENVTATAADVRIDTNRGPQRVTIQMEPVK